MSHKGSLCSTQANQHASTLMHGQLWYDRSEIYMADTKEEVEECLPPQCSKNCFGLNKPTLIFYYKQDCTEFKNQLKFWNGIFFLMHTKRHCLWFNINILLKG